MSGPSLGPASDVVVASLVGFAQSAEISSEADYDAAMKEVGATFRALRSDMDVREGESVLAGPAKLAELFEQVGSPLSKRHVRPASAAFLSR